MLWVRISIRARCTTLCDKVCQWLATGRWFSPGPPVSSINKTDRLDIAEILLKVALNTIKQYCNHDKGRGNSNYHIFWCCQTNINVFKVDSKYLMCVWVVKVLPWFFVRSNKYSSIICLYKCHNYNIQKNVYCIWSENGY